MNLFFYYYYYYFLKNVSYLNAILCFRSLSVSSYALLLFIFMAVHLKRAKKKTVKIVSAPWVTQYWFKNVRGSSKYQRFYP